MSRLFLFALIVAGCASCATLRGGPPSLQRDPAAVFAHYRAAHLDQFQMHHQVETRFGPRSEVVDGFLIVDRPDRFWVRALSPFGATLFDVKDLGTGDMVVDIRLAEIADPRAPAFLARDIRRIYLADCDADAALSEAGGAVQARCVLPATEAPILTDAGPDAPDDLLVLRLDAAGLLRSKQFSRGGEDTARVELTDYRQHEGHWLAHHIELHHAHAGYGLTIELLGVDPDFDAAAVFDPQGSGAAPRSTRPSRPRPGSE